MEAESCHILIFLFHCHFLVTTTYYFNFLMTMHYFISLSAGLVFSNRDTIQFVCYIKISKQIDRLCYVKEAQQINSSS